jgi:hypothetical protein
MKDTKSWIEYMKSDEWARLRNIRLRIAGYRCENEVAVYDSRHFARCENTKELQMNHLVYPQYPYAENDNIENVRIYCAECHDTYHYGEPAIGEGNWL